VSYNVSYLGDYVTRDVERLTIHGHSYGITLMFHPAFHALYTTMKSSGVLTLNIPNRLLPFHLRIYVAHNIP
jgi:hypothetical protein